LGEVCDSVIARLRRMGSLATFFGRHMAVYMAAAPAVSDLSTKRTERSRRTELETVRVKCCMYQC
jgi:hypothetical protein